jgi:AraC-like DNA-binding protein
MGSRSTYFPSACANTVAALDLAPLRAGPGLPQVTGSARVGAYRHLPEVLKSYGVRIGDALGDAGIRADIFDSVDNWISYRDLGHLQQVCERITGCDHVLFLAARLSGLDEIGLSGRIARCAPTAGEALRKLSDHFTLQNSASILSLLTSDTYASLVFTIVQQGMGGTGQFQVASMAIALNVLRELCGPRFLPTVVTFACRSPSNLRELHKFFRTPLQFDRDESALVFEQHWLDRPVPPVDPAFRRQVEAEERALWQDVLTDVPATVRFLVRKELLGGSASMDRVAGRLGMHRRTLERHLGRQGLSYRALMESVQSQVACQLLLDTEMPVQDVAEALHFSSAANFATAFRRWTGVTPSEYRRRSG